MLRWVLVFLLSCGCLAAQTYADSARGAEVIRDRGCLDCHAVAGKGGGSAPDLAIEAREPFTPAVFAAAVWNHAPAMWEAMAAEEGEIPLLKRADIRDVFAYLYSVRYFDPAGSPERGRAVFRNKNCFRCHAVIATDAGGIGPPVRDWLLTTDPVVFLEQMWNHGDAMLEEVDADQRRWPTLSSTEMADLMAYVFNLPGLPARKARLQLGAPAAGMKVFADLKCSECHTTIQAPGDKLPLAAEGASHRTLTDLAAAMWNHRPLMEEWAEGISVEIPKFQEGQMGQLLSYLVDEGFLESRGEPADGAAAFYSNGCLSCHGPGDELPKRDYGMMDLIAGIWMHGPDVREAIKAKGGEWPEISAREMADIVVWLNSR